jgi:hypothetical protein
VTRLNGGARCSIAAALSTTGTSSTGARATTGNFQFDIGQIEGDFASPRHRHNFDQFRFQLEGTMNFDRNGKMGLFLSGSGITHDSEYRRWTAASRSGGGSRYHGA